MTSPVEGKTVVLTGTLTQLKRADAQKQLAALGAIIGKSLGAKTDLLIYGERAGSKLTSAQRLGVEARDEAWLMDVLAGGDGESAEREALEGPLSGFMAQLQAWLDRALAEEGVKVGCCIAPPASDKTLSRLASAWGLERFSPAITNLYKQTDGLFVFWLDTNHPDYPNSWGRNDSRWHYEEVARQTAAAGGPVMARMPSVYECEMFPWSMGGITCILPCSDALKRSEGFFNFAYDVVGEDEEREAFGRTWRGESLERAIRVFDVGLHYYPVGFLTEPISADPPVLVGDDYGAAWGDSRQMSFEAYMEGLLHAHFTLAMRRGFVVGYNPNAVIQVDAAPVPFASLLTPPEEEPEGEVVSVGLKHREAIGLDEARGFRVNARYRYALPRLMKIDALTDRLETPTPDPAAEPEAFATALVRALADTSAFKAPLAREIATALWLNKKTKSALIEALRLDWEAAAERVTLTACADEETFKRTMEPTLRGRLDAVLYSFYQGAVEALRQQLGDGLLASAPFDDDTLARVIQRVDGELRLETEVLLCAGAGVELDEAAASPSLTGELAWTTEAISACEVDEARAFMLAARAGHELAYLLDVEVVTDRVQDAPADPDEAKEAYALAVVRAFDDAKGFTAAEAKQIAAALRLSKKTKAAVAELLSIGWTEAVDHVTLTARVDEAAFSETLDAGQRGDVELVAGALNERFKAALGARFGEALLGIAPTRHEQEEEAVVIGDGVMTLTREVLLRQGHGLSVG